MSMEHRQCPRCGILAAHGGQFCGNCGCRLFTPQPVQVVEEVVPVVQKLPGNLILILAEAVILALAAVGELFFLY